MWTAQCCNEGEVEFKFPGLTVFRASDNCRKKETHTILMRQFIFSPKNNHPKFREGEGIKKKKKNLMCRFKTGVGEIQVPGLAFHTLRPRFD